MSRRAGGGGRARARAGGGCRAGRPADDLTQLVGVGPKASAALAAAGITTYAALAELNEPQVRHALHDGRHGAARQRGVVADAGQPRLQGRLAGPDEVQHPRGQVATRPAEGGGGVAVAEPTEDLTQIKGIGPRIASILNDGGITNYAQLEHANGGDLRQIIATGGALPPGHHRQLADPGLLRQPWRLGRPRGVQQQPLTSAPGRGPRSRGAASRIGRGGPTTRWIGAFSRSRPTRGPRRSRRGSRPRRRPP